MGGKSSSSSSSSQSTTNTTNTETLNAALSGEMEQGAVALQGETNNLTMTSDGAFDVVKQAMFGMGELVAELSENQKEVMGAANTLASSAMSNVASAHGIDPVMDDNLSTEKTKIAYAVAAVVATVGVVYVLKGAK